MIPHLKLILLLMKLSPLEERYGEGSNIIRFQGLRIIIQISKHKMDHRPNKDKDLMLPEETELLPVPVYH